MIKSIIYAVQGILTALKRERNLRFHIAASVYVITAAVIARLSLTEWCIILLCCGLVIALELVNTALELLCDKISPERCTIIGAVKNIAACAVLTAAIFATAIGIIIFSSTDKIKNIAAFLQVYPVPALMIALTSPGFGYLVFRRYK